jgi:hypothetical protein
MRPRLTTRPSVPDPVGGDGGHSAGALPLQGRRRAAAQDPDAIECLGRPASGAGLFHQAAESPLIVDCQTRAGQIRGHPGTLAASPSMIAHESPQTPATGPRSANGRAGEAFSRVPSRRRATRPGLGGRSQGAIPGAIGGRCRATQGDAPRQSVQLSGLQSDARRRTATHRRCLLSNGSRVRILPGALTKIPGQHTQWWAGHWCSRRATPPSCPLRAR